MLFPTENDHFSPLRETEHLNDGANGSPFAGLVVSASSPTWL